MPVTSPDWLRQNVNLQFNITESISEEWFFSLIFFDKTLVNALDIRRALIGSKVRQDKNILALLRVTLSCDNFSNFRFLSDTIPIGGIWKLSLAPYYRYWSPSLEADFSKVPLYTLLRMTVPPPPPFPLKNHVIPKILQLHPIPLADDWSLRQTSIGSRINYTLSWLT